MSDKIKIERKGAVTTLRLNDPDAMNALTPDMAEALHDALRAEAKTARAIVLAGSERAFCAGANLKSSMPQDMTGFDAGLVLEQVYNPMMETIRDLPVPIIAAVRGAVVGVGASIALACDIVVAGKSAYFLEAFARIGLVPDGGATWLITQAVGRARAMEMMLMADKIPAHQALDWGLITRMVEDVQVEDLAATLAARLAEGPTQSYALIRQAVWTAANSGFSTAMATERVLQKAAGQTEDYAEGLAAFQDKRPARFHG